MSAVEQFQQSVFDAIDIDRVIWVDDFFRNERLDENLADKLKKEIEIKYESGECEGLDSIPGLEDVDFSDPLAVVIANLPTDPETIETILKQMNSDDTAELNENAFQSFTSLFDKYFEFQSMSLLEWNNRKSELVSLDKTLFFVDLDFSKDGGARDEGKLIVDYILRNSSSSQYCVLFTHNCLHGAAEEKQRLEITSQLSDVAHHTFSVLSKSIFGEDDGLGVEFKAPELLKRAFVRKLCSNLAESISIEMKQSVDEIRDQLNQHSIYELDGSIFHRSLKEGASEFDVIHRLFALKQSSAIHELIKEKTELVSDLKKLRDIQKIQFKPQNSDERKPFLYFKSNIKPGEWFSKLRNSEIWTDADSINVIHAPIRCGDTFTVYCDDGSESHYILLEQSCDLIVRDNGMRKLNEALLVPFEIVQVASNGSISTGDYKNINEVNALSKYHSFSMPGSSSDQIIFDFSNSFNVNLNLLDLCVFNENGEAQFSAEKKICPELIFLPGWLEKYSTLYEKLVDNCGGESPRIKSKENICGTLLNFTLNANQGMNVVICADKNTLSVNVNRGNRLNPPFSDVLLSKLYGHKTRLPLEHDFSDLSWD
ncbi:MAG: hypothetical protein VYE37_03580 [Pseudomonadota bacterium]|nr:hypothetical protein [Pseudomonadota bacterium]